MSYSPPLIGTPSTLNSSTANLGIGGVFTGTAEDVSMYSTITVSVFADQVSATDGLSMQQSPTWAAGTWYYPDVYTVPASTWKTFHADRGAKFFRLVYTNGGVVQTSFSIQTLYDVTAPMGSSVRPSDGRSLQNDMREMVAYMGLYNGTTLDLARGTTANGQLVDVSRLPTITKGTQGTTGVTTQDLKDAGRNAVSFYMVIPVLATATDTLQSLTGTKSGATVTATTTPAVVTAGKTLRITRMATTYIATATAGYGIARLRFNTAGVVAITSPIAATISVWAGTPATANSVGMDECTLGDWWEFAAGTGIGVSVQGFAAATATAVGYMFVSVTGYEY